MKRIVRFCLLLFVILGCESKPPTDPVLRVTGKRGDFKTQRSSEEQAKFRKEMIRRTQAVLPESLSPSVREAALEFARAITVGNVGDCRQRFAVLQSFGATEFAVPALLMAWREWKTSETATNLLAKMGPDAESAIPELVDSYLGNIPNSNLAQALHVLEHIGPKSVSALASWVESDVGSLRVRAILGVKEIALRVAERSDFAGRPADASDTLLHLLAVEKLEPDPHLRAEALTLLAAVETKLGRYKDATGRCQEALEIIKSHDSDRYHLDLEASIYNCQGRIEIDLGEYKKAEDSLQRALETWERAFGDHTAHAAVALNNLGMLYTYQRNDSRAREHIERARDIWAWSTDIRGSWTPRALSSLGLLNLVRQEYKEAEDQFDRALLLFNANLSDDHPDIASTLSHQALLFERLDRLAEAEEAALRSLEIFRTTYGPEHPNVARSGILLAIVYARQGRAPAAASLWQEGLALLEKTVGLKLLQDADLIKRAEGFIVSDATATDRDRH